MARGSFERGERETGGPAPPIAIVGSSVPMLRLRARMAVMAANDAHVLITGESGTGKELVARVIHAESTRCDAPFVAVNCAGLPEALLEAELFGYERGAFTGAVRNRAGRFQAASGGTLFLDEIGELSPAAQAKLLRVLQEGTFEPLGTNTSVRVDVRVVSATHRDLKAAIASGGFREDLYYRVNVLSLHVPPLRERREDLAPLVEHFLAKFSPPCTEPPSLSPDTWAALVSYSFPGNVRELEHAIQQAVVLANGGTIDTRHLSEDIALTAREPDTAPVQARQLGEVVREFEHQYILQVLRGTRGNRTRAAEILGISRKTLWEKLRGH